MYGKYTQKNVVPSWTEVLPTFANGFSVINFQCFLIKTHANRVKGIVAKVCAQMEFSITKQIAASHAAIARCTLSLFWLIRDNSLPVDSV